MSEFPVDELLKFPELPSATDVLFKPAEHWRDNSCLNYAPDDWLTYALGYKEAADRLVAQLEADRRQQDLLVYPIVFLYRQYLELAIKGVIRQAQALLEEPRSVTLTHQIDQLWVRCADLLKRVAPGDSVEEQRQIGRLIREFSSVDPSSSAFRYPVDSKGNRSLAGLQHISLPNVRNVVGKIAVILDGASAQIDYLSDCMPRSYL